MSIRWDPILVRCLAEELDELLGGARLRAVRLDGTTRDVVLLFRERTVLWRLHPRRGHLVVFPPREPPADALKLTGRVRRVWSSDDERALHLSMAPARSGHPEIEVHVELLGNQWNLIVAESPGGRIRHVLVRRTNRRSLVVGETYVAPAPLLREGRGGALSLDRWMEILEPVEPEARSRMLVRSVAYASPLNALTLLGAAARASGPEAHAALEKGWTEWKHLADGDVASDPVVLETDRGPQPYPFPLSDTPFHRAQTLLDALALCSESPEEPRSADPIALLPGELFAELERTVDAALRRTTRLEAELEGLEDADELRGLGNLLLAHYGDIPAGASEVVLPGFSGGEVAVPLDPGLQPHENASRLYARASRVERARKRLPALIAQARAEAARLEDVLERARDGRASEEEVRNVLPARTPRGRPARGAPEPLPYRSYTSTGGLEIRVGKGARQNDELTFHHSAPGDVWLHARHAAGAHVILRWSGTGGPPNRDLTEAAVLAALNSQARTSGSVPVDWTLRKYVRKPRGSAPGRVVLERARTLFVAPDPDAARRLSGGSDDGG